MHFIPSSVECHVSILEAEFILIRNTGIGHSKEQIRQRNVYQENYSWRRYYQWNLKKMTIWLYFEKILRQLKGTDVKMQGGITCTSSLSVPSSFDGGYFVRKYTRFKVSNCEVTIISWKQPQRTIEQRMY